MSENRNSPSAPGQRALVRAKQKAARLRKAADRETIFELIVAGYNYATIAKELGVCEATVRREVQRALDSRKSDAPERYVALQKARLDRAMQAVDSALGDLDLRGVPALVQLLTEYDRYEGLSARLSGRVEAHAEAGADLPNLAPKRLISAESKTAIGAQAGASAAPKARVSPLLPRAGEGPRRGDEGRVRR